MVLVVLDLEFVDVNSPDGTPGSPPPPALRDDVPQLFFTNFVVIGDEKSIFGVVNSAEEECLRR